LQSRMHDIRVFARMDPAQKIRIVQALQHSGELVAMTGDGVNDAPALKQANIGIAMGKGGTDVAREAADMVLLDDNFATIVSAIQSGRHIYDNIRRFIRYVLTTNLAEILIIFLAPLFGLPLPLLPLQILWINLVTDGLPGLALTLEPPESDSMQRPPRAVGDSLLSRGLWQHVLVIAVLMSSVVLGLQAWSVPQTNLHWQSLVFTTLTFTQLSHVLAIRSDHNSLWQLGLRSNLPLFYTVLGTVALHLALLYHPLLQRVFNTSALTLTELALCCGGAVLILLAVELEKWLIRHQYLYQHRKTDDHH
jgi:Ca2+-transporting ATPase